MKRLLLATVTIVFTTLSAPAVRADAPLAFQASDKSLTWGGCPDFLPKGCAIAPLHGDPSKPNPDILLKVPGRSKLPSHKHTSAERMVLVQGVMDVTYSGTKPVRLRKGSYAYGPAGHVHEGTCKSAEPCILFIAFEQPVDAIAEPMPAEAGQP